MLELLNDLKKLKSGRYLFPGLAYDRPMSAATMAALLSRIDTNITVHGFRSAFRDWAAETTSFPRRLRNGIGAHN